MKLMRRSLTASTFRMSLQVVKTGIHDTIQDGGRPGYARWGINTNGAMDSFARSAANALVGNGMNAAVLEIHFPSPEILFHANALVSITGADFTPSIGHNVVPTWKTLQVPGGSVLSFGRKVNGMRCYVAVHGGLDVPEWLGSRSTNTKACVGGLDGRLLRKDDHINIAPGRFFSRIGKQLITSSWSVSHQGVYNPQEPIGLIQGREFDWLDESSKARIFQESFSITPSSDRMASFLQHAPITFASAEQLLSSAVMFGTIQALPSGQLCVLMADHQTTGGYPKVAHVISAHLPRFAQLSPGEHFTFKQTTIEDAEKMLLSLHHTIMTLNASLTEKLESLYGNH
jgi:antagonist of KipI